MSDYLHGAYGYSNATASPAAEAGVGAIVYVGTAPVHTIEDGAKTLNKPIVVRNIAEARKIFGYSADFASYTLCEAMHVHFEQKGVGPLILINVLDPVTDIKSTGGTATKTPSSGKFEIAEAADIVLDSVLIKTQGGSPTTKVKGTDYTIAYNPKTEIITVTSIGNGLGTAALDVTYDIVDPSAVDDAQVVGSTDELGTNTGLYALKSVYDLTGYVPAYLCVPGFSSSKTVHDAMKEVTKQINSHWDCYFWSDIALAAGATAFFAGTMKTYKTTNGYDAENETVCFPMVKGTDGVNYHLSVLRAATFQEQLIEQEGIPYKTASNIECDIIQNLYFGESHVNKVFDAEIVNEKLNKIGISSAAFVGGRWVLWGSHGAAYEDGSDNLFSISETNCLMMYYLTNDFQIRRPPNVDVPLSLNDLQTIVAEEQGRLDALVNIGALTYGVVELDAENINASDVMKGDFKIIFNITTTPLVKSLTAVVNWTDLGYQIYFENTF